MTELSTLKSKDIKMVEGAVIGMEDTVKSMARTHNMDPEKLKKIMVEKWKSGVEKDD